MAFEKMTVIGATKFTQDGVAQLKSMARELAFYKYVPRDDEELISLIADSDCLLVALEVKVSAYVIQRCTNLKYIGMCCSLYSPQSANVDILAAEKQGVRVTGIRDYGDEGVVEYVISELVSLLHGFHDHSWRTAPYELTNQNVGVLGMGTVGTLAASALQFFKANVFYYSRTRKPEVEKSGVEFLELPRLLEKVDILICCLNKNAILLYDQEFALFGNGKILMNISIGPCFDTAAFKRWIGCSSNYYLGDDPRTIDYAQDIAILPNVVLTRRYSGESMQSVGRYNEKIIANIRTFLSSQPSGS